MTNPSSVIFYFLTLSLYFFTDLYILFSFYFNFFLLFAFWKKKKKKGWKEGRKEGREGGRREERKEGRDLGAGEGVLHSQFFLVHVMSSKHQNISYQGQSLEKWEPRHAVSLIDPTPFPHPLPRCKRSAFLPPRDTRSTTLTLVMTYYFNAIISICPPQSSV